MTHSSTHTSGASTSAVEPFAFDSLPDAPPEGQRWSSWDGAQHGPTPRPDWVITALGAVDADLGVLKTGKEADVHVLRRWLPDGTADPSADVLMAAKRFRTSNNRLFHRDAGYLEGRRVRRSREMRAMAKRTEFGKELVATQWAGAEFWALGELVGLDLPVPYPVQLDGNEMLMEFIGTREGIAAPRLATARPAGPLLRDLYEQLYAALTTLAAHGWAHGDLSAYNMLLDGDRLVIIDWPQIVDIIGNPQGFDFLHRDCVNICQWFVSHGLDLDAEILFADLVAAATSS